MGKALKLSCLSLLLAFSFINPVNARTTDCDQIIGDWISEQKNFVVEIVKDGESFKAIILWFDDSDDRTRPMNARTDYKNPNKSLRSRKILGLNILRNLTYNSKTRSWENGIIYDSQNGREWNSCAALEDDGSLKVTGYWHFKFIGRSVKFTRVTANDRLLTSR